MTLHIAEVIQDPAEYDEDFDVVIEVISVKHDCNAAYLMTESEQMNARFMEIVRTLKHQLRTFIKEKKNARQTEGWHASEAKEDETPR